MINLVIISLSNASAQTILAQGPLEPSTEPIITKADETGLSLVWTPPTYSRATVVVDGVSYSQVQIAGLSMSAEPGHPQLPIYGGLIGLPPAGEAQLQVVELEREIVSLPHLPPPAPVPQAVHLSLADQADLTTGGPTRRLPDPTAYSLNAFQPETVAHLGPVQQLRNHRLVNLTIHPLRVNPVTGQMEVIRFLRLEITFSQPVSTTPRSQATQPDLFAQALGPALLNSQATEWVAPPGPPEGGEGRIPPSGGLGGPSAAPPATKVLVAEAGLYALTYSDLQGAGLPVNALDSRTLKLSHGYPRQEVAIWVEGESDGIFNPGDRLLFYAEPAFSRFVDYDVYFLSYGDGQGLRMTTRTGDPAGLPAGVAWRTTRAESNRYYEPLYPGRDGDRWYWDDLRQPDRTSGTYPISLDAPLTGGPEARLTLWLQGYTNPSQNPDHRLAVAFNGTSPGEIIWDGAQAIEQTFNVPASGLKGGQNELALTLPGAGTLVEGVWLDAFELSYPTNRGNPDQLHFQGEAGQKQYTLSGWPASTLAVYDITSPDNPRQVTGYTFTAGTLTLGDSDAGVARYLAVPEGQVKSPLALTPARTFADPPNGADYIIITHPNFAAAIAPLAAHRASQGLRVVTVEVGTIYDAFGAGRLDPQAIRNFVQHAYTTWAAPAPLYLLLVGDGSYDFKNYSGFNPQMFIPPDLADVDPWLHETASDNRFVTVAGDDNLPDLLSGRLAVNSEAEATTVVNKIINYETDPPPGNWNAWHLFVADDPDAAGDFHANADQAYVKLAAPLLGQRFYFAASPTEQPYIYTDVEALRSAFRASFNQGAGVVTFHGHSSWHQWAAEALFRWSLNPAENDVTALTNERRLPLVFEMTCFTAFFHHPEYPTIDESLLRLPGGGAVAVYGSTGLGVASGHDMLQAGFYQAIVDQGQTNLGTALLASKVAVQATGLHLDLLDTYMLLGDPALTLDFTLVPLTEHVYLPLVRR
jgi:hypothetical protein